MLCLNTLADYMRASLVTGSILNNDTLNRYIYIVDGCAFPRMVCDYGVATIAIRGGHNPRVNDTTLTASPT